jgi:hypothetical protein
MLSETGEVTSKPGRQLCRAKTTDEDWRHGHARNKHAFQPLED